MGFSQDFSYAAVDAGANMLASPPRFISPRNGAFSGIITVRLALTSKGEVTSAEAVGEPESLRLSVLNSARQWRFRITAKLPSAMSATVYFGTPPRNHPQLQPAMILPPLPDPPPPPSNLVVETVAFVGVSDSTADRLRSSVTLRVGEIFTSEVMRRTTQEIKKVDKSFVMRFTYGSTHAKARVEMGDRSVLLRDLPPEMAARVK